MNLNQNPEPEPVTLNRTVTLCVGSHDESLRGGADIVEGIAGDEREPSFLGGRHDPHVGRRNNHRVLHGVLEDALARFQPHEVTVLDVPQRSKVRVAVSGQHTVALRPGQAAYRGDGQSRLSASCRPRRTPPPPTISAGESRARPRRRPGPAHRLRRRLWGRPRRRSRGQRRGQRRVLDSRDIDFPVDGGTDRTVRDPGRRHACHDEQGELKATDHGVTASPRWRASRQAPRGTLRAS